MLETAKTFWNTHKSAIFSLMVFIVLIIPGVVMPNLIKPEAPQNINSFEVNLPTQGIGNIFDGQNPVEMPKITNFVVQDTAKYEPLSPKQDQLTQVPLMKDSPRVDLPGPKTNVNPKLESISNQSNDVPESETNKLLPKKDLDIFEKTIVPTKSTAKISWESGLENSAVSNKYSVGTLLQITKGNKTIYRKVTAMKVIDNDARLHVDKNTFIELGLDPVQNLETQVEIEQL